MTTDTAERTKRLTLSEIVGMLLMRGSGDRSSVTLLRNAKGETQIEVTVRTGGDDAPTIRDAETEAQSVYERLREQYPLANGGAFGGSSVALTRNAKGETQIEVAVKTADGSDVATVEEAERRVQDVYDRLRSAHPLSTGYIGAGQRDKATVTPEVAGE